jgi:Potential Queuosine, Q, salvage protein family
VACAQIFAGDMAGAFQGRDLGRFRDVAALTMFADYRVPVVLRGLGLLRYSDALAAHVRAARRRRESPHSWLPVHNVHVISTCTPETFTSC